MAEKPEDFSLPNSVVTRIIKEALPEGVNVSKEARTALSKAACIFVLYATSCANNFAMKAKRKTLNANDVLLAMEEMEFEKFVEPLKESLEAYRREKSKKEPGAAATKGKKRKPERETEGRDDVDEGMEEGGDESDNREDGNEEGEDDSAHSHDDDSD